MKERFRLSFFDSPDSVVLNSQIRDDSFENTPFDVEPFISWRKAVIVDGIQP